jgi:hypothetical protein
MKENREPVILDFNPAETCKECPLSNNGCNHNLVEMLADLQDKGLLTTDMEANIDRSRKYYTTRAPLDKIKFISCNSCGDWWIQDRQTDHACKCNQTTDTTRHNNTNKNFVSLVASVTAVGGVELTAQKACELIRGMLPNVERSVSVGIMISDRPKIKRRPRPTIY